jgi:LEA14-like dessication related protein
MYLVEKIGELILVTMEGQVTSEEVEAVKHQLKEIAKMEDEAVVSLKLSSPDGSKIPVKEEKSRYNEIIEFCNKSNIRIYSYVYEEET